MNSFGKRFRISIYGESHGAYIGVCIDGCPAGIPLCIEDFMPDIERRKPGAKGTTPRIEDDIPIITSGMFNNFTTGTPLNILFENKNIRSQDYELQKDAPRPGHADFVMNKKFNGYNDFRGGGHSSGRLTLCLVAAGVIAKKILTDINIKASLIEAGGYKNIDEGIAFAIKNKDSIGGIVQCVVNNVPVGWGEPFFDSIESSISHIVFSIPAVKGIAFGSGFNATKMLGSEHNDTIINANGKTKTNNSGGINGGVSNGNDIVFDVAIKPTSSTPKEQYTWNNRLQNIAPLSIRGRHDLCIALRAPIVIEAATAIALADYKLL